MQTVFILLLVAVLLGGCPKFQSGPPSVKESSAVRVDLVDRVRFIETYVTFRRTYNNLDYAILYQNNGGGMVPGPSDWDIRLIAIVPPDQLDSWVPVDAKKNDDVSAPQWLTDLPGPIKRDGVTEWYRKSGIEVGIDRDRSIVAYRNTSTSN